MSGLFDCTTLVYKGRGVNLYAYHTVKLARLQRARPRVGIWGIAFRELRIK